MSPQPDLRRFRTYKGNSVRDLLRAMRNKVRLLFSVFCHTWLLLLLRSISDPFSVSSPPAAETSLSRVAPGRAGDAGWAARGLRQLLHVTLPTVADAHAHCHARLQPRETVSPLLSDPQQQIGATVDSRTSMNAPAPYRASFIAFVKPVLCFGWGGI